MTTSISATFIGQVSSIVRKNKTAGVYGPVGVDIDTDGMRLAQFRNSSDNIELIASAFVPLSTEERHSPEHLRTLIKNALRQNGFIGREVVTSLRPENVKILMLSFMRQADKQDEELIVQRIAERIDDDISKYVIDYMMVRPDIGNENERSVLVALADHDEVVSYLELLRKAGLTVKLLEIEPTAVRRLVTFKHENQTSVNLMTISMGCNQTYITVLSGRRLIYVRDIDFGEVQLVKLLCKELDINEHDARTLLTSGDNNAIYSSDAELGAPVTVALYSVLKPLFMELVEDINRALIYAASETRGVPVSHVYLTNQVATWHGIDRFINTLIEVPVSVLMPFEGLAAAQEPNDIPDPRNAVVAGLALHGMTEAS